MSTEGATNIMIGFLSIYLLIFTVWGYPVQRSCISVRQVSHPRAAGLDDAFAEAQQQLHGAALSGEALGMLTEQEIAELARRGGANGGSENLDGDAIPREILRWHEIAY